MKSFFKLYAYDMVKMFLNQFGTAVFGISLALATAKAQNEMLRNVTSIGAIVFYLVLLYCMTWEIGFRDKISMETGKRKMDALIGVKISLGANAINFLFAIFIMLASLFNVSFFSSLGGFGSGAALILEGMYTGLLANHVAGAALNSYWWVYFLLPLPAIGVSGLAYSMGLHDIKLIKGKSSAKNPPKMKN